MEIRVMVSNKKTAEALASLIMSEAVGEMLKNQGGEVLGVLLPNEDVEDGYETNEDGSSNIKASTQEYAIVQEEHNA